MPDEVDIIEDPSDAAEQVQEDAQDNAGGTNYPGLEVAGELTEKNKQYLDAYIRSAGDRIGAAVAVSPDAANANSVAAHHMKQIRKKMPLIFEGAGVTPKKLADTLAQALDANKTIYGRTVDEFIDVPDHMTRLKAVELGAKLLDITPRNEEEDNKDIVFRVVRGTAPARQDPIVIEEEEADGE